MLNSTQLSIISSSLHDSMREATRKIELYGKFKDISDAGARLTNSYKIKLADLSVTHSAVISELSEARNRESEETTIIGGSYE